MSFFSIVSLGGCVSDPSFEQANDSSTTTDTTVSATRDMVLVPATTITTLSTKDTKGKGKPSGKSGDDDDDAKTAPPPPRPPAPTPAAPTESSVAVPAFWIDRAAVARVDYDACVDSAACSPPSCVSTGDSITCITHEQASTYCAWRDKRMVRDAEWTAAANQMPAGLTGLSGGAAEWVLSSEESGIVRGGATSNASTTLGLASSIPQVVGFRCARDR